MAEEQVEFELVTPERLLVSRGVDLVVVPGEDGDFGVLPRHTPMISNIRPGVLGLYEGGKLTVTRARKIQRFLSQPFFVAEVFTGKPGVLVSLEDTIRAFKGIVDGEYDHLPEAAFYMVGTIEEAVEKAREMAAEAA